MRFVYVEKKYVSTIRYLCVFRSKKSCFSFTNRPDSGVNSPCIFLHKNDLGLVLRVLLFMAKIRYLLHTYLFALFLVFRLVLLLVI